MFEKIAIVNNDDFIIGYEDKMKVHELGILHRAFSVFIFNDKNELLLQKELQINTILHHYGQIHVVVI